MGIKITSITVERGESEVFLGFRAERHFIPSACPPCVTGEFESTYEIKVGQRFAVNANRFDGPDLGGCPEGVAVVTSIGNHSMKEQPSSLVPYFHERWMKPNPYVWVGTFEMEGEVTVVATDE